MLACSKHCSYWHGTTITECFHEYGINRVGKSLSFAKSLGYDKLDEFCDLVNLTNLIKSKTCFTKNHKTLIDLFLTNTPLSFQKTHVSEADLSDYQKLITTFFKTNFSRLRPKVSSYRNYKNFFESKFLNDLNKTIISFENEKPIQNYNVLSNRFLEVVNVHAPLKTKMVRGNDAYPNQVKE